MKPSEILEKVIVYCNTNYNKLATDLGLKRSQNLYDIRDGKTNISPKLAQKITKLYPEITKGWLLTGEGNMLKSDTNVSVDSSATNAKVVGLEKEVAELKTYILGLQKEVQQARGEKEKYRDELLQAREKIITLLEQQHHPQKSKPTATEQGEVGREGNATKRHRLSPV
jgi:predicted  nucleic acid-binding Zn-ribbon protein